MITPEQKAAAEKLIEETAAELNEKLPEGFGFCLVLMTPTGPVNSSVKSISNLGRIECFKILHSFSSQELASHN